MKTRQEEKYAVGMAGEHFVAAELLRRGVLASVTIGNAKKADVIARNLESSKIEVIEIKSSSLKQWVVGGEFQNLMIPGFGSLSVFQKNQKPRQPIIYVLLKSLTRFSQKKIVNGVRDTKIDITENPLKVEE